MTRSISNSDPTKPEYIISPYDPSTWGDMWRLEIQIIDKEDQLTKIVNLLDKHGIMILSSESRKAFDETWSVKNLMIDCQNLNSEADGNSQDRIENQRSEIPSLRDLFFCEFSDSLRYSGKGYPRLSITRNWPHFGLFKSVAVQQDTKIHSVPERIMVDGNGEFEIPGYFLSEEDKFQHSLEQDHRVYVSINTRSKIIYSSVWREEDDHSYISVAIFFDGTRLVLAQILKAIGSPDSLNLNVVRHQLRGGILSSRVRATCKGKIEAWTSPYTLNLLVERRSMRRFMRRDEAYLEIEKVLGHILNADDFELEHVHPKPFSSFDEFVGND
ncbi:hypothetical protein N9L47_07225 [Rhodobacteraceae bacterium]|nr:hypothetical protein [Paracoccaceae bacterium]